MNNKWFTVCLIGAFISGVLLTTISFMIFSKSEVEEKIVYTHSTVDVNEIAAIKNMMQLFDSLPNNTWMGFYISYHPLTKAFRINLNYNDREFKHELKSYEDFILFISDKKLYYDDIMSLGK